MGLNNLWRWLALTAIFFLLSGCSLFKQDQPRVLGSESPAPLTGAAWMTCSQACRDRGQCGQGQSIGADVVLLNTVQPDVVGANMILGAGTPVTILQSTDVELIKTINFQETYLARFYLVEVPNRAPAWVAGWCVEQ